MRALDPLPMLTRSACIALLALVVACGGGEDPPDAAADGERPAAMERTGAEARDAAAVRDFRLTMDHVRGYAAATENVMNRAAADPAFRERVGALHDDGDASMEELIRRMEGVPELRREIERAGISAEDYMKTVVSMAAIGAHVMMREMGHEAEADEWVSERNLAFFEENRAEIEEVMQRVQEMDHELFDEDDDW